MSRAAVVIAAASIAFGAMTASAQSVPDLNAPRKAAEKAANAENARLSAQTGQELRTAGKPAPTGKPSGPATQSPSTAATPAAPSSTAAAVAGNIPPVTREIFSYAPDARRDPFYSLILTEDLRPLLSDLRLVGILYAGNGGRSVAIMRDLQTNAQYRVSAGMTLGRMSVTTIRPKAVVFTIDEFGLKRQDSLFIADTSKTRIR